MKRHLIKQVAFIALALYSTYLFANPSNGPISKDTNIGKPGDPNKISRIIKITTTENIFLPNEIYVKEGETIKFVVKNAGNKKHEMIINTMSNLKKYAKKKRNNPEIKTIGLNHIQLDPGEHKALIWEFTKTGTINFACPLPGHFKGMRGKINVET